MVLWAELVFSSDKYEVKDIIWEQSTEEIFLFCKVF